MINFLSYKRMMNLLITAIDLCRSEQEMGLHMRSRVFSGGVLTNDAAAIMKSGEE